MWYLQQIRRDMSQPKVTPTAKVVRVKAWKAELMLISGCWRLISEARARQLRTEDKA